MLALAAALERGSEHPLAASVLREAKSRGLEPYPETSEFISLTGRGIRARVDSDVVLLGNGKLLEESGIAITSLVAAATRRRDLGQTILFVAVGNQAVGFIAVADPIKVDAKSTLTALRALGLHLVMLTGDHRTTAGAVANELGIEDVRADILPDGKAAAIRELQARGRRVAMAGDGVNDAPALSQAEVGIAMGTGTDIAMQSAGITLVKGDLRGIVRARTLAVATLRNIRQNLFFAFAYNSIGVPIAAGVLFPVFGLLLSPMFASAAMSLSSVSVIGNALRLRRVQLETLSPTARTP
jgi:Cu+-exporting ATPase